MKNLSRRLADRQKKLGISARVLAQRSGVSLPAVIRLLNPATESTVAVSYVSSVTKTLGLSPTGEEVFSLEYLRKKQARRKAERIMRMVQGNVSLESQGLEQADYETMVRRTVEELLNSPQQLWSIY